MPSFPFAEGPQGRSILVDENGAIVSNDGAGPFLVYQFGPKGRAMAVDASGRMAVRTSSPAIQTTPAAASGNLNIGSGRIFDVILDDDLVITNFQNPDEGAKYVFILEQDATGSRLVTWPATVKWRGGAAPTLTVTASGIDVVTMLYRERDSTFLADVGLDFS